MTVSFRFGGVPFRVGDRKKEHQLLFRKVAWLSSMVLLS